MASPDSGKFDWGFTPLSSAEQEERIGNLRQQMQRHNGEFVLVTNRWWSPRDSFGHSHLQGMRCLALIEPPCISQFREFLTIHTPRFAYSDKPDWNDPEENDVSTYRGNIGPIFPQMIPASGIGVPLKERRSRALHDIPLESAVEIVVGDENVVSLVQQLAEEGWRRRITAKNMETWRKTDLQKYEAVRSQYFDLSPLLEFWQMERGLGRVIQLPTTLENWLEQALEDRKLGILRVLRGGGFVDLKIATLKTAFRYHMHEDPHVWKHIPCRGVTEEIDLPEYIRGCCERYGVLLPEKTTLA